MITETLDFVLTALSREDKAAFLARSTGAFATIVESQFDAISNSLAAHLRSGFKLAHLGDAQRRSGDVSVFKITFADASDEVIAIISERDGKVDGLLLK